MQTFVPGPAHTSELFTSDECAGCRGPPSMLSDQNSCTEMGWTSAPWVKWSQRQTDRWRHAAEQTWLRWPFSGLTEANWFKITNLFALQPVLFGRWRFFFFLSIQLTFDSMEHSYPQIWSCQWTPSRVSRHQSGLMGSRASPLHIWTRCIWNTWILQVWDCTFWTRKQRWPTDAPHYCRQLCETKGQEAVCSVLENNLYWLWWSSVTGLISGYCWLLG